jgi:ParB family transcriptional regulator, chromosome partitioning protein
MKAPVFRELAVDRLKSSPFNPPHRSKKVPDLIRSLGLVEMIFPIMVSKDYVIIDGHRRVAAAKRLGWKTVPAVISDRDAAEIYAHVNGAVRKMGGNDALNVYLKNPDAVVPWLRSRLDIMRDALGKERLKKMAGSGYSLALFYAGYKILHYTKRKVIPEQLQVVVDWLMKVKISSQVHRIMLARLATPAQFNKAINSGKSLLAVSETSNAA